MPISNALRHGLEAFVHDGGLVVGADHLGAHGDGRTDEAVGRTIHGKRNRDLLTLRYFLGRRRPFVPGRLFAWHRHLGLLEQRRVHERTRDGELGHEAWNGVAAVVPHPVQRVGEVLLPVGGVLQHRAHVEPVPGERLQVRHPGDIRAATRLELHRQLLADHVVGHRVEDDLGVGVLRLEPLEEVLQNLALVAVRIPHDADLGRKRGGGREGQGQGAEGEMF
jgi:hypothetical protein